MQYPERNPYVGPRTFEETDSGFFFGRDREARELLSLVIAEPLTLFYAQSGAGKSSLINTRLIPSLREEGFVVLPVSRVGGALPVGIASDDVPNIFVFNLLLGLDSGSNNLFSPAELAQMTLADYLTARREAIEDALFAVDEDADEPAIAVVLDQFEEILTTHLARWHERESFFEQLAEAMKRDGLLWVVCTLREDFVAGLEPYARLFPGRLRARFYMKRMGARAAQKAIEEPAAQAGRPFAPAVARRLVDNLRQLRTTAVLTPNEDAAPLVGEFVEPVQLQVVCYQLWDNLQNDHSHTEITQEDVDQLGNVDEALAAFYEEAITAVVNETNHSELELRSWFERELITEAQTRGTVYQGRKTTAGMPNTVISQLADRFLLRAEIRAGGTWYELVHDRFVDPILQANNNWRAAQSPLIRAAEEWFDNDRQRDLLYQGQQLKNALAATEGHTVEPIVQEFLVASREEEARQLRARQRLVLTGVVLTILVLLAFVSSVLAVQGRTEAIANAQEAQANAELAQTREAEAAASAALAATREAEAQTNLGLAEQSAAEAQANLELAQSSAAEARANADLAATRAAEAEMARQEAEIESQNSLAQSLVAVAPYVIDRTNDTERAVLLSLEAAKVEGADRDIRRLIDNLLRDILSRPYFNSILEGHRYFVYQAVFSPTRPWLASVDDGGELLLWDFSHPAPLPRPLNRPDNDVSYWHVAFDYAPDSDHLAVLGTRSTDELVPLHGDDPITFIDIWNLQNQAAGPQRLPLPAVYDGLDITQDQTAFDFITNPAVAQFALNGDQLLWLSPDQTVYRYDLTQPDRLPVRLVQDSSPVVTLSPSGRYLATGDRFGLVRLRDLNFPTAPTFWFGQSSQGAEVTAVAFDITEQFLATANTNNVVRLWDATNDEPDSIRFPATDSVINALAVSPGGNYIVSNSTELSDLTVRVWDTQQPANQPVVLEGHNSSLNSLGFNGDGTILASTSDDKTVRLWNFSEAKAAPVILNEGLLPSLVQFSQDGELLTAVDRDETLYFWALNDLSLPPTRLPLPLTWPADAPIYATGYAAPRVPIAIAPDARTLATAEGDDVKIWRVNPILTTVNEIYNLPRQTVPISALAFNEKQDTLAVADTDGGLRLYKLANLGSPTPEVSEMTFLAGDVALERLAFSPDGRWLAGSLPQGNEYAVRVWDLTAPTAAPVTLFGPTDFVADLAFAHGSDQLAAASYDTGVYLWQIAGDAVLPQPRILEGHEDYVFAVAFAPNDETLASSSWDTSIRLWDLAEAGDTTAPALLSGHSGQVVNLDYSAQDDVLVSLSDDGTVRLWSTQIESFVEIACELVRRNLSWEEWVRYQGADVPYSKTCDNLPVHPTVIDVGRDLARENEIDTAVAWFQTMLALDPTLRIDPQQEATRYAAQGLLKQGEQLAGQNKPAEALNAFEAAQALATDVTVRAHQWALLCRAGAENVSAVTVGCNRAAVAAVAEGDAPLALALCRVQGDAELSTAVEPACDYIRTLARTDQTYNPTLLAAVCALPPSQLANLGLDDLCNLDDAPSETLEVGVTVSAVFSTTAPARWQFVGVAGEQLSLTLVPVASDLTPDGRGSDVAGYVLYDETGALLEPVLVDVATANRVYNLPLTGTYTLEAFGTGEYVLSLGVVP